MGRQLAAHVAQLERLEGAKRESNKEFNGDIKLERVAMSRLQENIRNGFEMREVSAQRALEFKR